MLCDLCINEFSIIPDKISHRKWHPTKPNLYWFLNTCIMHYALCIMHYALCMDVFFSCIMHSSQMHCLRFLLLSKMTPHKGNNAIFLYACMHAHSTNAYMHVCLYANIVHMTRCRLVGAVGGQILKKILRTCKN